MIYLGDFPASHTAVCIPFDSFAASTGASSATSGFANSDILIYKDGGVAQRASAAGITVSTSFDSQTGLNMIVIDLSDNTDPGFYAAAHEYQVGVADITIDSQTVRFWAATFSIERAGGILALLKARLPNATPGAAGGLFIAGANAATTTNITGNLSGSVGSVTGAVGSVTARVSANVDQIDGAAWGTHAAGMAPADVRDIVGAAVSTSTAQLGVNAVNHGGIAQTGRDIGASVLLSAGTGAGQLDFTAGIVKSSLASVIAGAITNLAFAAGAIDAAAIGPDAIGASELAADAVTEIQTGLSTLTQANVRTAVGLASANLDTQLAAILAKILDAPGVRAAIGLAAANLDTQLGAIAGYIDTEVAAILAKVTNLPASPASVADIPTANQNAAALLDLSAGVETALTVRQALRVAIAALAGKASGMATTAVIFRDTTDAKNRISATVDASGNRTAVTLDTS